ncbi:MAG: ABC transporter ATP-binding protein [Bacteroidota bacterium]
MSDLWRSRKENIQLRKKEFWGLFNVSFDLFAGDILGVVGANGSGKTTLMRIITGIYYPDAGVVYKSANKKITAIFVLGVGLRPLFTGKENIYIEAAMYGMTKKEVENKMDFIVEFSELQGQLDRPLGNYSSGMRARLAYAVALSTEPDIFIVDEALAVGDAIFQAKCFEHLKKYVQQPGKAVLFVSNHIRKVLKVANRVLVMDDGQIIHESTDVKGALSFYINNCLKHLDEDQRQLKLKKINDYNL